MGDINVGTNDDPDNYAFRQRKTFSQRLEQNDWEWLSETPKSIRVV